MTKKENILIIGNGKTGSKVTELLPADSILAICDSKNPVTKEILARASTAIIFVSAPILKTIIPTLLEARTPVVCGTTGLNWNDYSTIITESGSKWIVGSNFSVGMNLMFFLAKQLSKALSNPALRKMNPSLSIKEQHHIHKLDSPSGTALRIQTLLEEHLEQNIPIFADRVGDLAGIHQLNCKFLGEKLELTHTAHDRKAFAQGAINAVGMLEKLGAPGLYYFDELLFI